MFCKSKTFPFPFPIPFFIRGDNNYEKEEAELIFCKNTSKLLTFNEERQRQVLSRVEKDEDGSAASQIRFVFDKIFEQRWGQKRRIENQK